MSSPGSREAYRFGDFELDVPSYELRRQGRRVRLERRPMDLLILLVQRRGDLVTRSEIVERLWGQDVFIEVETGVNTLVRKIRQALRDSADAPSFVETVPGKGYRFIAPVEISAGEALAASAESPHRVEPAPAPGKPRRGIAIALGALLLVTGIGAWAWKTTRVDPERVTVAVLPFEMISVDPTLDYLEDALHEETIAALGQVDPERIEVVTRRLLLPYREAKKPPAQIAQEVGADFVVESSIVTESGRIRVRAKLLRARDQAEIWNDSYDNAPRSMLDFQRELALTIAGQIRHRLSQDRLDALARRHTDNAQAFQLYMQGLHAWNQLKPPLTTHRALEFYTRATQLDPGYALPWAGLALAYAGAPINGDADARKVGPAARKTAERALAADPTLAEAKTAMGAVKFWFDWDWEAAERLFRDATAADPNYAFARRMIGIVLSHEGRHDEAQQHMRELFRLEPSYEMNWALRAQVAFNAGDYAQAIAHAEDALALQPRFWIADFQLAMAYAQSGRTDLALQTLDKHASDPAANSKLHSLRGYILGRTGRAGQARAVLTALETASRDRYVPACAIALVHAGLGDRAAALDWLERAYEEADVHLIALGVDPKWTPYRNDPRFAALIKRRGIRTN